MVEAIDALRVSLNNDLYRLNTISQNLANVSTSGYKRESVTFNQFAPLITDAQISSPDSGKNLPVRHKDLSQSTLKYTGSYTDISIDGEAFFVVEKDGLQYGTRVGSLRAGVDGKLEGASGEIFQGQSGAIYLEPGDFEVAEDGVISQNGNVVDKLLLVSGVDTREQSYMGNGLYGLDFRTSSEPVTNARIRQGFLETSNVKTMDEMVKLIDTTRHFESVYGVLKAYDDVMNLAINKLADF